MDKVRVRFGIRLGWPIANAAVFVFYASPDVYALLEQGVGYVRTALVAAGQSALASKLVCERS